MLSRQVFSISWEKLVLHVFYFPFKVLKKLSFVLLELSVVSAFKPVFHLHQVVQELVAILAVEQLAPLVETHGAVCVEFQEGLLC